MALNQTKTNSYDLHTELVLGACMNSREFAEQILFGTALQRGDLPQRNFYPELYDGIVRTLRTPDVAPTPEIVWTNTDKAVDLEGLRNAQRDAQEKSIDAIRSSVSVIIGYADRVETHKYIKSALDDLTVEKNDIESVRNRLIGELSRVRVSETQPSDSASILARFKANLGTGVLSPLPSMIPWIATVTNGGLRKRRMLAIGAPDKSRKTTFMRNILRISFRSERYPIHMS